MKISVTHLKRAVVASSMFSFLIFPSIGITEPVTVQTQGNRSNASAGESGASLATSAEISIVPTLPDGSSPAIFGTTNIGSGTSEISLPAGWSLQLLSRPLGGCPFSATYFRYLGSGNYVIGIVPAISNPRCQWLSGDYHYVVRLNGTFNNTLYRGSGLGVLTIP